jgi:hypothetical protein
MESNNTELIQMVMRQTTYSEEEAITKLQENDNDIFKVLRDFMRIPENKTMKKTTINQTIYKEIRTTLGSVPIDFNINEIKK